MMRQAKSAIRELKRLQAERRETESDPEASDRGERTEHITTVLLDEGLADPETVMASTARREDAAATNPPLLAFVSSHDPKSRKHKIEIPPRQSDLLPPAKPTRSFSTHQAHRMPPSVSSHDSKTRKHQTETPARHPAGPKPQPLVGAWRLAHLFPIPPD